MLHEILYEWDFAISYAKEDRDLAKELACELTSEKYAVFFYDNYEYRLIGCKGDDKLKLIFGKSAAFFVPIVSQYYSKRMWSSYEWDVALRESKERSREFIIPIRVDDTPLLGLSPGVIFLDAKEHSIIEIAHKLSEKYKYVYSEKITVANTKWVATFGLLIGDDIYEAHRGDPSFVEDYPHLCDWMEERLLNQLKDSGVKDVWIPEPSLRTGESLSVRVAFEWDVIHSPLEFEGIANYWEVLEVLPFESVYGTQ